MNTIETSIAPQICEICAETLRLPIEKLTPEARLLEDLEVDSLFIVQLSLTLEERFSIEIPEDELAGVKTVQDLCDYVSGRLGAR